MSIYTIDETEAIDLTSEYRTNQTDLSKGFLIDKAEIDEIFTDHPEATQFRAYLGQEENAGKLQLVMVAVDANGDDILGTYYDRVLACPTHCSSANILNS